VWFKVSNVFNAQPSFASDLAAMVPPILGKIDTMHQRCGTMINVSAHWFVTICSFLLRVVEMLYMMLLN